MMGRVDAAGRALLGVAIVADRYPLGAAIEVWIDTGFTGDVVLPLPVITELGLTQSGSVDAVLADGSQIELATYSCRIRWFDEERHLEVIANDGEVPLVGVGLLWGNQLSIDYVNHTVSLLPAFKTTS